MGHIKKSIKKTLNTGVQIAEEMSVLGKITVYKTLKVDMRAQGLEKEELCLMWRVGLEITRT